MPRANVNVTWHDSSIQKEAWRPFSSPAGADLVPTMDAQSSSFHSPACSYKPERQNYLTPQQRARIDQNFRAAKALLARKRGHANVPEAVTPRLPSPDMYGVSDGLFINKKKLCTANSCQRDPLAELPANTSNLRPCRTGKSSTSETTQIIQGNKENASRQLDSSEVLGPEEGLIRCKIDFTCISKESESTVVLPTINSSGDGLDDIFEEIDETILEEIDNACKQNRKWQADNNTSIFTGDSRNSFQGLGNTALPAAYLSEEISPSTLFSNSENEFPTQILPSGRVDLSPGGASTCSDKTLILSPAVGNISLPSSDSIEGGTTSEDTPDYLHNLNDSQRDAALSDISKPLLILAGPGSGKTSTMVARVVTLLKKGVDAGNILAMTFTTAAAAEMRERIGKVIGKSIAKQLTISTFHSFCLQLCRSHAEKIGRTSDFLIYGHGQQRRAVIEATRLAFEEKSSVPAMDREDIPGKCLNTDVWPNNSGNNPLAWKDKAKKWQQFVAQCKASGMSYADIKSTGNEIGAAVVRHYDATLAACNALDYHDFITCSVKLLSEHSEVLDECQTTWTYLLVDEFQDTSATQYRLLHLLASHCRVTIVGDDDQSIFSFNGANASGFNMFRADFPDTKEVRLHQNYRSTRCIVEAAAQLIRNNVSRCQSKEAFTANNSGDKITVKECRNEETQCAFVVDTILQSSVATSKEKPEYGNIAVLYRRQITGRLLQSSFRTRKIPFNVHGVAFYRKKVVKNVIALLWASLPGCPDNFSRRIFKALYAANTPEAQRAADYVEKQASCMKSSFLEASRTIFMAKISGTFNRRQLCQGRKALTTIEMVQQLVSKECSLSSVVTAAVNLLPQRPILDSRAVLDESGGKLLNEDDDPRTILEYLLDDVGNFLTKCFDAVSHNGRYTKASALESQGCQSILQAFLNHILVREGENFRLRRQENNNSVTLTTMHQSKGLEWDTVFIVKANEMETPLLHEVAGHAADGGASLEEERRLFYVAMTRARKKLYILHIVVDSQRQVLRPSRFIKELPRDHLEFQGSMCLHDMPGNHDYHKVSRSEGLCEQSNAVGMEENEGDITLDNESRVTCLQGDNVLNLAADEDNNLGTKFLRGFNVEVRSTIATLFHNWAKKPAFQDPHRLLHKVRFVIDERLRSKAARNKDALHALKCSLKDEEALLYATHIIRWEKLPPHERAMFQAERQEHFQQQSSERAMASASATAKQISYLKGLGCTINPTSRLHASKLIEQYKNL